MKNLLLLRKEQVPRTSSWWYNQSDSPVSFDLPPFPPPPLRGGVLPLVGGAQYPQEKGATLSGGGPPGPFFEEKSAWEGPPPPPRAVCGGGGKGCRCGSLGSTAATSLEERGYFPNS